jgi:hypothetical protein
MKTRILSLGCVLVLTAGLAACGSSDSKSSGKPLTKSELISQGDGVCTTYGKKIDGIDSPSAQVTDNSTPAQVKAWEKPYTQLADLLNGEADALAKLTPPTADAESYAKVISDIHIQAEYSKQAAAAAKSGDSAGVINALAVQKSSDADSEEFLTSYGFKVCGS